MDEIKMLTLAFKWIVQSLGVIILSLCAGVGAFYLNVIARDTLWWWLYPTSLSLFLAAVVSVCTIFAIGGIEW